ncbi:cadmium-translocating P-type ATPase [Christensenellaceae bacterium NSJ-63]|uniref:Cd(2+)-exporting ATPase n=1 Tax=Guopingia tenuis TaxID=2763656 RepID=A0A926DJ30_9FIRM|nr:heavy metal translocating P-type ATPase [Guopingia tenuis]MBC8538199.1 cadmium-translocating P-type ATPase [Guopingia tenuis]
MTRKQKRMLVRIGAGAVIFAAAMLLPLEGLWRLGIFLAAYGVTGWDVLWRAVRNIARGKIFDENFLMSIATVGAFVLGEYPEGVAVMLFYQVGEWFQGYAVHRSRRSIAELMDIRPDYANVERDGQTLRVDPEEVAIGETILVKPGEKIPLDGEVIQGSSTLDTAALTGESLPREAEPGAEVLSGCINGGGLLRIRVTKHFGESTVSKILEMVENASSKKARSENFITRFAKYYTPVVVIAAALLAVVPPLVVPGAQFSEWVHRALIFLVISCPCALVISVPMSFFGGIGGASRQGILVKGSNYLEMLAQSEIVVLDKTGTLTKGNFQVTEVRPEDGTDKEALLEWAAYAECYSSHPIALSLRRAYGRELEPGRVDAPEEAAGRGLTAKVDGHLVAAGNRKMMEEMGLSPKGTDPVGTVVHVAVDGTYRGRIVISDEIKEDARQAMEELKRVGVQRTVMLTGDAPAVAEDVAKKLAIDEVYAGLLPLGKVEKVEELWRQKSKNGRLAFVGDGINDAPVLSRADIGIAMGGLGSDAAIEAADIVIMDDKPSRLATAIKISKKTVRIVRENIVFALGVKAVILALGALGIAGMWLAVFADVGVAFLAILNAMRALRPVK